MPAISRVRRSRRAEHPPPRLAIPCWRPRSSPHHPRWCPDRRLLSENPIEDGQGHPEFLGGAPGKEQGRGPPRRGGKTNRVEPGGGPAAAVVGTATTAAGHGGGGGGPAFPPRRQATGAGLSPAITQEANGTSALGFVAAGLGVTVVVTSYQALSLQSVRFVPVVGHQLTLQLAWAADN